VIERLIKREGVRFKGSRVTELQNYKVTRFKGSMFRKKVGLVISDESSGQLAKVKAQKKDMSLRVQLPKKYKSSRVTELKSYKITG
jgi:hypothetical protein